MAGTKDIFGYKRNPKPDGVFSTEESILTFGGDASADMSQLIGYLVQSWGVNYQQQVQEIFEIGSSALYWMKGRPQGVGTLTRIIGEQKADSPSNVKLFPKNAYDLCDGGALLKITAKSGACGNKGGGSYKVQTKAVSLSLELDGCVITSMGFQVQVSDTLINENVQFRFGVMSVK